MLELSLVVPQIENDMGHLWINQVFILITTWFTVFNESESLEQNVLEISCPPPPLLLLCFFSYMHNCLENGKAIAGISFL